ncbi:hypothetical protein ACX3YG_16095 [Pseudomonas wadenswilerensis]
MRIMKVMLVAGLLASSVGVAQAADGMERVQRFQAQFQAEQERLWGDRGEEGKEQVVKQEKEGKKADS